MNIQHIKDLNEFPQMVALNRDEQLTFIGKANFFPLPVSASVYRVYSPELVELIEQIEQGGQIAYHGVVEKQAMLTLYESAVVNHNGLHELIGNSSNYLRQRRLSAAVAAYDQQCGAAGYQRLTPELGEQLVRNRVSIFFERFGRPGLIGRIVVIGEGDTRQLAFRPKYCRSLTYSVDENCYVKEL